MSEYHHRLSQNRHTQFSVFSIAVSAKVIATQALDFGVTRRRTRYFDGLRGHLEVILCFAMLFHPL